MKKMILVVIGAAFVVQTVSAAEPVGTGKYDIKLTPTLQGPTTKLVFPEDLVRPTGEQKAEGNEAPAEDRPLGVDKAASDAGSIVLKFFSSAVNVGNVMRLLFGR